MSKRNECQARPVRMESGYRDTDGREQIVSTFDHPAGTFRADVAVPSERPGYPVTADEVAYGVVSTFERFTWGDYQLGDTVQHRENASSWWAPGVIVGVKRAGAIIAVSTFPGLSFMTGPTNTNVRHAVELSAVAAERVAEIRAYRAAVAR